MDKEVEVSRSCLIQVSGGLSGKFGTQMLCGLNGVKYKKQLVHRKHSVNSSFKKIDLCGYMVPFAD